MKITGIIPARYASTRFPGKPLAVIDGKTMIQRVIEQVEKAQLISEIIIATDDDRIFSHVHSLGKNVIMTSPEHPSGTDRCLEALDKSAIPSDAIINIQGDEPFVAPEQIDSLAALITKKEVDIATLAKKIEDAQTLFNPNKVKVVFSKSGRAIYFSRHAIPYQKSIAQKEWLNHHSYYKHLGLYAYKTSVLRELAALSPSPLEQAESLEQLRWLENGKAIFISETTIETPAVDTPEDLEDLLEHLKKNKS